MTGQKKNNIFGITVSIAAVVADAMIWCASVCDNHTANMVAVAFGLLEKRGERLLLSASGASGGLVAKLPTAVQHRNVEPGLFAFHPASSGLSWHEGRHWNEHLM